MLESCTVRLLDHIETGALHKTRVPRSMSMLEISRDFIWIPVVFDAELIRLIVALITHSKCLGHSIKHSLYDSRTIHALLYSCIDVSLVSFTKCNHFVYK
jgi:hypothetical protein